MSNTAKKIVNTRKTKNEDLRVVESRVKKTISGNKTDRMSLEEILKIYPGLSLDNAALLCQAHDIFKKTAA